MGGILTEMPGQDVLAVLDDRNRIRWTQGTLKDIVGELGLALIAPEDRNRVGELLDRVQVAGCGEVQFRTIFDQRWVAELSVVGHTTRIGRAILLPEVADRRVQIVRPPREWEPSSPMDAPPAFTVEAHAGELVSPEWVRQFNSRMLREQVGLWAIIVTIESVTQSVTSFLPAPAMAGASGA